MLMMENGYRRMDNSYKMATLPSEIDREFSRLAYESLEQHQLGGIVDLGVVGKGSSVAVLLPRLLFRSMYTLRI